MAFRFTQKILFKHCDPAGIVFYPRYFEMLNDVVEAFFDDRLQAPFSEMHREGGVPTARIGCTFTAPSRHGDVLEFTLECLRIGRSSLDLAFRADCGGERRLEASSTLVHVGANARPLSWPSGLRDRIEQEVEKDHAD